MDHQQALAVLAAHHAPEVAERVEDYTGIQVPPTEMAELLLKDQSTLGMIIAWGADDTPTRESYPELVYRALGVKQREQPAGAISEETAQGARARGWRVTGPVGEPL